MMTQKCFKVLKKRLKNAIAETFKPFLEHCNEKKWSKRFKEEEK